MPQSRMNSYQKSVYWDHRESETPELQNSPFLTEQELKDHSTWSKSKFKYSANGRNILNGLRSLRRIKEVRGKSVLRFALVS
jgi:hypothetical protein